MVNSGSEFTVTKCPNCGQGFKVDRQWNGKKATCPKCKKQFVINISKRELKVNKHETHKPDRTQIVCTKCENSIEESEVYQLFGQGLFCRKCYSKLLPGQLKQMTLIANYLTKKLLYFFYGIMFIMIVALTWNFLVFTHLSEASWIFVVLRVLFFSIALKELIRPDRWGPLIIGIILAFLVQLIPLGIIIFIVSIQNCKEASPNLLSFTIFIMFYITLYVHSCLVSILLLRDRKKWQEGLALAADTSLVQQVRKALKDCIEYDFIQFRVPGIPDKHWRIYLCPNYVLLTCLNLTSRKNFFVTKGEFSIRTKKDILVLSGIKIDIQLDQKRLVGYMSKKGMERFNNWKNQNTGLQSEKKDSTIREN